MLLTGNRLLHIGATEGYGEPMSSRELSFRRCAVAAALTAVIVPLSIAAPATASAPAPQAPRVMTHRVPVAKGYHFSYHRTHSTYPATDIFVRCGAVAVAPTNGVVLEVRREDLWVRTADNPALRGGRIVSMLGDDGVRYYMAHFQEVFAGIEPGVRLTVGQPIAIVGRSGRAGGCHIHFSISPRCAGKEWKVRRGVIWPWRYLDAWRRGYDASPRWRVNRWLALNPQGCARAMADRWAPYA